MVLTCPGRRVGTNTRKYRGAKNDRRLVALSALNACLDARIVKTAVRLSIQLVRHRTAPEHCEHAHKLPSTCPQPQTWLGPMGRLLHSRVRSGEPTKLHLTHRNARTNACIGIRPMRRVSGRSLTHWQYWTGPLRQTAPLSRSLIYVLHELARPSVAQNAFAPGDGLSGFASNVSG